MSKPLLAGLALCLGLIVVAPRASAGQVPSFYLPGPFDVTTREVTLVDERRPTAAHGKEAERPSRVLKTTIWYPSSRRPLERLRPSPTPVAAGGPFPILVYSHGFSSFRSEGRYLARRMASRGYVVVAADFPLTNYFTDGGPRITDVVNQPGDVSFLLDQAAAWTADPQSPLFGAIDMDRAATAGLSLGGLTTTLVAFHPTLRDPRLKAAVSMAGVSYFFGEAFFEHSDIPYMMLAGTADALVDYPSNAAPLPQRDPTATLVSLKGGSHLGFTADARPLFLWHHHPDALACWIVGRRLEDRDPQLASLLGGPEVGIEADNPFHFCELDPLPRAMGRTRQLKLSDDAVQAFLSIHLSLDPAEVARASAHLYEELPAEADDLTVQRARDAGPATAARP